MGNYSTKSYNIHNSAMQSGKSEKDKMNQKNRVLQKLGCTKIYKRRLKEKSELVNSQSNVNTIDNCEANHYSLDYCDGIAEFADLCEEKEANSNNNGSRNSPNKTTDNASERNSSTCSPKDLNDNNYCDIAMSDGSTIQNPLPNVSRAHARLSEISINSDDLMLSTDVNLDQADDDVSKDYNANEKDDPFISSMNDVNSKMDDVDDNDRYGQGCAEDSERNDIVYFDSSRESSVSLQRKIGYRAHNRRPHSFSTPLRSDGKCKPRRSSNLSTVDSVDMAWTWMSASESANIVQEISNLKLMLLKTRRLLLDDFNNDLLSNGSVINDNDTNVFSEPGTPIFSNDQSRVHNSEFDVQSPKSYYDMDKESLIQELQEASKRNYSLQCQLSDKNRVIELLQDNRRRFQRPHARTEPVMSRIARSSTFDSSIMTNALSPTQDSAIFTNTFSADGKILKSDLKNIDSGLYQSSSSTDSYLYQN